MKQQLKKTFKPNEENPNIYGWKPVLIKLLRLFNYWSNQMEKLTAAVKIFLLTRLIFSMWLKMQYMCIFMAKFASWSERLPEEKTKLLWEASLRCHTFCEIFYQFSIMTNSHLFLFAFIWNMALMCIPVYNLESYEHFRRVFAEVYVIVLLYL